MTSRTYSLPTDAPTSRRQRGFGLIEFMIAVFIGLFLLGGLAVVLQMTSNIFGSQTGLSLLQDEERLGMNLLTRVQKDTEEFAKLEQTPKMEGRQMMMVLAPR